MCVTNKQALTVPNTQGLMIKKKELVLTLFLLVTSTSPKVHKGSGQVGVSDAR